MLIVISTDVMFKQTIRFDLKKYLFLNFVIRNHRSSVNMRKIYIQLQRWGYVKPTLVQRCINVAQCCFEAFSTLCNIILRLFQRRGPTLYQRCAWLNRRRILLHFQRRINVISTLIYNLETTLMRRWNVGWVWREYIMQAKKWNMETMTNNR